MMFMLYDHLHQIPQALLSSLLVVITEESLASHPTNGQGHKRRSTNIVREKREMTAAMYVSYIIPYRRVQGQKTTSRQCIDLQIRCSVLHMDVSDCVTFENV